jgi:hypothetical protein
VRGFNDALVGQIFNRVTLAAVGADAYRVMLAGDREGGRTRDMAMVVLERFLGFGTYASRHRTGGDRSHLSPFLVTCMSGHPSLQLKRMQF